MNAQMKRYFFDAEGDLRMEAQNEENWEFLADLVEKSGQEVDPRNKLSLPNGRWDILDIGCHASGLLEIFDQRGLGKNLFGIEPLPNIRRMAEARLPGGKFFGNLDQVPDQSVDLVVSHETLYLVPSLYSWLIELKRILRPDGGAFISLGSHSENTAWMRWRMTLEKKYGHISYPHQPIDILRMGAYAGFDMELHRLIPDDHLSSTRYSPSEDGWGEFLSAKEALEFRQQKYVFVFYPKR